MRQRLRRLATIGAIALVAACGSGTPASTASVTRSAAPSSLPPTGSRVACVNTPPPSAIGNLVYLKGQKTVLSFGGHDPTNTPTGETWMRSAGCWTKLQPTTSPSPRDSVAMAVDEVGGQVILYGGRAGGPGQP